PTRSSPAMLPVSSCPVALAKVVPRWFDTPALPRGLSPLASISPPASIGSNVTSGAFVAIGDDVVIGEGSTIYPNVSIYRGCKIGKRCILHSGAVIGADGFGFATEGGRHHTI